MKFDLLIRDVFKLTSRSAVLACEGEILVDSLEGCKCRLVSNGQVRQVIILAGERLMLNKISHHRALETHDSVSLTSEEAQSGHWRLVCDD